MRKVLLLAAFGMVLLAASSASAQCNLTVQTESLPAFFVGEPANFQIEAVSGTPPYKFESIGEPLPEGLHLTPSGRIVGVTRQEGNRTVLFFITDAAGCTLGIAYDLTVFPAP